MLIRLKCPRWRLNDLHTKIGSSAQIHGNEVSSSETIRKAAAVLLLMVVPSQELLIEATSTG
ncbi:MAG: hypothetical protein DMG89_12800 [Acidobacteria bacterium]|nr:MAG: hypothetical protein DMG89_12800 [Acidobacteriota bacterium]